MRAVVALVVMGCGRFSFGSIADAGGDGITITGDGGPPPNVNIMFTTAMILTPASLGGISGADSLCQASAGAAALPGKYVAFLSDSSTSARDRIGIARGWVRPDGQPFVDDVDALLSGRVWYPPLLDEHGQAIGLGNTRVATGTNGAGMSSGLTCNDWSSTATSATYGYAVGGDIQTVTTGSLACDTPMHIYCFGVDYATPIAPPPITGKRAFIASGFGPGGGISSGDMHCATEAATAGLTGSFRALLATTTTTPASRFAPAPRYRMDGVRFTEDFTVIDAPLRTHANGTYSTALVWTGTTTAFTVGTSQATCNSWTATGGNGTCGSNEYATSVTFDKGIQYQCSSALAIYCLEE